MDWNNEYWIIGLIVGVALWFVVKGIIRQFTETDHGGCSSCSVEPGKRKETKRRFLL